jgi:beta-N-acetylhexosaminidase
MSTSQKNLRLALGSLMVVGISGSELTSFERTWLRLIQPSGIILFRRNIVSAAQTRALLADATSRCAPHPFRCVDVEGGSVDRLRDALAPIPSAQSVFNSGKPALMRQHGELIARATLAFGFNTTLAPVLDLALPASSAVMGTRTTSPNPEGVISYAHNFLAGLRAHNVIGCAKHFPGLGGGTLDSHLETPSIHRNFPTLWSEDLAPYRALHPQLPMVMVNHAAYPETPSKQTPATASPFWATKILRKKIGYKGIIFSDDLEMGGILKHLPISEAAIAAIQSGIDLIEICHSPELILAAYESLLHEAERSAAFRNIILSRAAHLSRHRARLFKKPTPKPLTATQFESLRTRILKFNEQIHKEQTA